MRSPDLGEVLWNPPPTQIGARNAIVSSSGREVARAARGRALDQAHAVRMGGVGGRRAPLPRRGRRVPGPEPRHGLLARAAGRTSRRSRSVRSSRPGFVEAAARGHDVVGAGAARRPGGAARRRLRGSRAAVRRRVDTVAGPARARARRSAAVSQRALMVEESFAALALRAGRRARSRRRGARARAGVARDDARRAPRAAATSARADARPARRAPLARRLARSACLSPQHFHQAFRAVYGESAHRYLTGLRLERARRLLRATDRSVTEICAEVGFESLGSFSALFKRELGVVAAANSEDPRSGRGSPRVRIFDMIESKLPEGRDGVVRIGLLADTHVHAGQISFPDAALEALRGVDLILHLGDCGEASLLDRLGELAPVLATRGGDDPGEDSRIAPTRLLDRRSPHARGDLRARQRAARGGQPEGAFVPGGPGPGSAARAGGSRRCRSSRSPDPRRRRSCFATAFSSSIRAAPRCRSRAARAGSAPWRASRSKNARRPPRSSSSERSGRRGIRTPGPRRVKAPLYR